MSGSLGIYFAVFVLYIIKVLQCSMIIPPNLSSMDDVINSNRRRLDDRDENGNDYDDKTYLERNQDLFNVSQIFFKIPFLSFLLSLLRNSSLRFGP